MKKFMKERDALDTNYNVLFKNLMRYEEVNVDFYSDSDLTKRIVTHPQIEGFQDKVDHTAKN